MNSSYFLLKYIIQKNIYIFYLPEDGTVSYFKWLPMFVGIEISLNQQSIYYTKSEAEQEYPPWRSYSTWSTRATKQNGTIAATATVAGGVLSFPYFHRTKSQPTTSWSFAINNVLVNFTYIIFMGSTVLFGPISLWRYQFIMYFIYCQ